MVMFKCRITIFNKYLSFWLFGKSLMWAWSFSVCVGQVRGASPEGNPSLGLDAGPPQQGRAPLGLWSTEEHFIRARPRQQDRHQKLRWSARSGQVTEKNPRPGPHWHYHRYQQHVMLVQIMYFVLSYSPLFSLRVWVSLTLLILLF